MPQGKLDLHRSKLENASPNDPSGAQPSNEEWGPQGKNQRNEVLGVGYQVKGMQIKWDITYPSVGTSKTHPTKECDLTQGRLSALENVSNEVRLPPNCRFELPWML